MACDLQVTSIQLTQPSTSYGTGRLAFSVATSAAPIYFYYDGYQIFRSSGEPTGAREINNIPQGVHTIRAVDSAGCVWQQQFTVRPPGVAGCTSPFALNWNPAATDDDGSCQLPTSQWFAVGGLYPPAAALATPVAALLRPDQTPRQGLHVEVELYREGADAPFAQLRQAVRTPFTTTNAEPYLRGLLDTEAVPVRVDAYVDDTAAVAFTYRYREVDSLSAGVWRQHPAAHYAVLSAPESSLRPYVAGSDALPLTAFAEPTQFVGLPLEVSAVLPAGRTGTWYAQWRYLDNTGQQVEIKAVPLPADLPAGLVRLRVPPVPPVCADAVELTLTNADRTRAANCPTAVVAPPTTTPEKPQARDFNASDFNLSDYR